MLLYVNINYYVVIVEYSRITITILMNIYNLLW